MVERAEKCTKQSAPTAVKNVRFLSSLIQADQSIAGNAGQRGEVHEEEDTNIRLVS